MPRLQFCPLRESNKNEQHTNQSTRKSYVNYKKMTMRSRFPRQCCIVHALFQVLFSNVQWIMGCRIKFSLEANDKKYKFCELIIYVHGGSEFYYELFLQHHKWRGDVKTNLWKYFINEGSWERRMGRKEKLVEIF